MSIQALRFRVNLRNPHSTNFIHPNYSLVPSGVSTGTAIAVTSRLSLTPSLSSKS